MSEAKITAFDALVADYGAIDTKVKELKKIQDDEKESIKATLTETNLSSYTAGGYTVTKVVSNREKLDEEKALVILKKDWIYKYGSMECPYIKTREYVDLDALENAIYVGDVDKETIKKLDECREVTTVISLKCAKEKPKKSEKEI